jgi:hypothetical protein
VVEKSTPDEVTATVEMPGRVVPHEVHLWPDETDWSCDCESPPTCART